jgi:hypothetical protein
VTPITTKADTSSTFLNKPYTPTATEFEYELYPTINNEAVSAKTEIYHKPEPQNVGEPKEVAESGDVEDGVSADELLAELVKQVPLEILFYKFCGKGFFVIFR